MGKIDESVIDLRELRIGNLLEYKGQIVEVTSLSLDIDDEYQEIIGFCEYGKHSNEHADWNRSLYNDLKRISLSPNWLAKCGFGWDAEEQVYYIQVGNNVCIEYDTDFNCSIVPETWRGHPLPIWGDNKYLHKLQNIYFDNTGEELKIKN